MELSGVHRDRQLLILEAWSNHRNIEVPSNLFKRQVEETEEERKPSISSLYNEYTRRKLEQLMMEDLSTLKKQTIEGRPRTSIKEHKGQLQNLVKERIKLKSV